MFNSTSSTKPSRLRSRCVRASRFTKLSLEALERRTLLAAVTINFDDLDASGGPVTAMALDTYLEDYGVTVTSSNVTPSVVHENNTGHGFRLGIPASPPNYFITQNTPNNPYSYRVDFETPLTSFAFTRIATTGALVAPWSARAIDENGATLSTIGEGFAGARPARQFTFSAPEIAAVIFERTSVNCCAGLNAVPTDNWVLTPVERPDIDMLSARLKDVSTVALTFKTTGDPGPFDVGLFVSADEQFDESDMPFWGTTTVRITPSNADGEETQPLALGTKLILPAATPFLLIVADPNGQIVESDRDNNVAHMGFRPDSTLVDWVIPTPPQGRLNRASSPINQVVLHATGTNLENSISEFIGGGKGIHYLITKQGIIRDGEIIQMVPEAEAAKHALNPASPGDQRATDKHSIGIELVDDGRNKTDPRWWTDPQLRSAALLVREISQESDIPPFHLIPSHGCHVPRIPTTNGTCGFGQPVNVLDADFFARPSHQEGFRNPGEPFVEPLLVGPVLFENPGKYRESASIVTSPTGTSPKHPDGFDHNERGILGHGQVLYRTHGRSDPLLFPWMSFMFQVNGGFGGRLNSPADFFVVDPLGRRAGVEPATGDPLLEIPEIQFSDKGTEPQSFAIPFAIDGTYSVQVVGTASGPFRLELLSADLNARLTSAEIASNTAPGLVTTYLVEHSSDNVAGFSITQIVGIDLKPGSDVNPVNLGARGVLPVAILTAPDFDATSVDISTIQFGDVREGFGRVAPIRSNFEDVDGDGDLDLIVHFSIPEIVGAGAMDGDTVEVELVGVSSMGTPPIHIRGNDMVRIVPSQASGPMGSPPILLALWLATGSTQPTPINVTPVTDLHLRATRKPEVEPAAVVAVLVPTPPQSKPPLADKLSDVDLVFEGWQEDALFDEDLVEELAAA